MEDNMYLSEEQKLAQQKQSFLLKFSKQNALDFNFVHWYGVFYKKGNEQEDFKGCACKDTLDIEKKKYGKRKQKFWEK